MIFAYTWWGQGWVKVRARSGQKARFRQGLGRQGLGKVWTKSKVQARSGQARSGKGWGEVGARFGQGSGKVQARSGQARPGQSLDKSKVRARYGQARSGKGWGKIWARLGQRWGNVGRAGYLSYKQGERLGVENWIERKKGCGIKLRELLTLLSCDTITILPKVLNK